MQSAALRPSSRPRESAGLLLFRRRDRASMQDLQVLLGHPGGPYWTGRDEGAWSIPKGGVNPGEDPLQAAIREFVEETSFRPMGPFISLGRIVQRSGKIVHAWAFEGDADPATLRSITAQTEWPPRSGRYISIPELDRVAFFTIDEARRAINIGQAELLQRLVAVLT